MNSVVTKLSCLRCDVVVTVIRSVIVKEFVGQWCHWNWNCIVADANTTFAVRIKRRHILRHNKHLFHWLPPFFDPANKLYLNLSGNWLQSRRPPPHPQSPPRLAWFSFHTFYPEPQGLNPWYSLLLLPQHVSTEWPTERGIRISNLQTLIAAQRSMMSLASLYTFPLSLVLA